MDIVKREKGAILSASFASNERDILIYLLQKHKAVLENKQSDAITLKNKEAAWKNIEKEFNTRSGGVFRSMKTLKIKYEGLKRVIRKMSAAISELYRTDGSKNTAPALDDVGEQIKSKSLITLCTEGLKSVYDSDIFPQTQEYQDDIDVSEEKEPFSIDGNVEMIENATHKQNINAQKDHFEKLTKAKLELVQLQKELLKAEILEKKKEWAFKENVRKWKEEEYKLRLEILRKELNE